MDGLREVMSAMLIWVAQAGGYWHIAPPDDIRMFDARVAAQAAASGHGGVTLAAYDCEGRRLYLPAGFDRNDVLHMSLLLHELVHHAQCLQSRFADDKCAKEREGYALQARWLAEQGAADVAARVGAVKPAICG